MAKIQLGQWEVEEADLDRQHEEAVQQGETKAREEPQATSVSYDEASQRLIVQLRNGVVFLLPRALVQGLGDASSDDIAGVRLGPRGASVHWDKLDLDFSLAGLIAGVFGTPAWMAELGRRGGQVSSEAKASAARTNGRKGGRPPHAARKRRVG